MLQGLSFAMMMVQGAGMVRLDFDFENPLDCLKLGIWPFDQKIWVKSLVNKTIPKNDQFTSPVSNYHNII